MKYLILSLLLLTGCNGEKNEVVKETKLKFETIELPELTHRSLGGFGGEIDYINDNSWIYTSSVNDKCLGKLNGSCRKAMTSYTDEVATNRVIKTDFEFSLIQYDKDNAPYWVIVYQDWVRIVPTDSNGNHPISTLKLKTFEDKINLCHYDNSWQWDYDWGENRDGDILDLDHTLHQENTLNGCKEIDLGVSYNISIINHDNGLFEFYVNDALISKRLYQTKSPTEQHVIQWGIYTEKGYNIELDPLLSIILRIDNLKLSAFVR